MGDIFTFGPWALQQDKHAFFCGKISYEWYDPTNEQPFTSVNFELKEVTLQPDVTSKVGTFSDAAIRFSYIDYPELHFNITVVSTIEECIVEKA